MKKIVILLAALAVFSADCRKLKKKTHAMRINHAVNVNSKNDTIKNAESNQLVTAEYENLYSQYRILNSTGKLLTALQIKMPKEGIVDEGGIAPTTKAAPNQKS